MMLSKNESKFIKSLKLKKYRQQERCFLVEGEKNVEEVLRSSMVVRYVLGTVEFLERLRARNLMDVPAFPVKQSQLESHGSLKTNQHGLAVVEMREQAFDIGSSEYVLALDNVSDPGNLGTILRTMDWFGFDAMLCSHGCADFHNPKTISATMGSFTRIQPTYVDLPEKLRSLQRQGRRVAGLVLDGQPWSSASSEPGIYVMGSESHGLSEEVRSLIDVPLKIEGYGQAESLNVAIATAILLYELRRP